MPTLIFDCDGVLADTERYGHLPAFNQMFAEFDVPVHWSDDDYAEKVLVGGGKERMRTLLTPDFVAANALPADAEGQRELIARWHRRKTAIYTHLIDSGSIPARPGVARIAAEARDAGWALAVASTSAEPSVRSVLVHTMGAELSAAFSVFAGDVVDAKKPAPDIYLLAVRELDVAPEEVLVVEDSANGLRAALAAGLRCIVTTSSYTVDEDFTGAALVVSSLGDPAGTGPAEDGVDATVRADPAHVQPDHVVRLADLQAVLARTPLPATTGGS